MIKNGFASIREELFEKEEKLKKVLGNYLKSAKNFKNVFIINGERPINDVFEEIRSYL